MLDWLFKRNWTEGKAMVLRAGPLNSESGSASLPYEADFEVHLPGQAEPLRLTQRLTVGRGRPFGARVWVAVKVNPARDALEIDWERTPAVQVESGDAASKLMAAMAAGVTDPAEIQRLLGAAPQRKEG
jgi:hypothetical protein